MQPVAGTLARAVSDLAPPQSRGRGGKADHIAERCSIAYQRGARSCLLCLSGGSSLIRRRELSCLTGQCGPAERMFSRVTIQRHDQASLILLLVDRCVNTLILSLSLELVRGPKLRLLPEASTVKRCPRFTPACRERGTRAYTHHAPARTNSVSRPTTGEVMRSTVLCIALGLSIASAKRDPSFIPADDEIIDQLHYGSTRDYHGVSRRQAGSRWSWRTSTIRCRTTRSSRQPCSRYLAALLDQTTMPSGINVRAPSSSRDDVTMPSLSIFRRKRRATFRAMTEAELRVWVYKELAGWSLLRRRGVRLRQVDGQDCAPAVASR